MDYNLAEDAASAVLGQPAALILNMVAAEHGDQTQHHS